ncbi:MAG: MFS transporter, partial [Oceanospirillum sp.]|nr:MFS transporter [Oceanospirillum sp.]
MFFLQDARVYRLLTGLFFEGVPTGLFMMALPWLMLKQGDNATLVALIALVCTLASFLLTPIFSTAIDRFSRKYVLVCVQLAQALTALLLMLASLDGEVSTLMMASAQLIYWVTVDLAWNCTGAFIQENFVEEEYPRI